MGACLSNRIKTGSPIHAGVNSTNVVGDGNDQSSLGGKFSSASLPPTRRSEGEILQSFNLKRFTLSELTMATRNFFPDSIIAGDDFGLVYKGWVDVQSLTATDNGTGLGIAVKCFSRDGSQGHKEWLAEINYLGQLHHPNLLKLIGHCLEDDHRLLVHEFMPHGSVKNHLLGGDPDFQPLSWSIRMKVALGAAKGLAFLHMAERQVIYRVFKTSNILLDSNYNAKVADFRLARDGPTGDKSHVTASVGGTDEYSAPEYIATGHLTTKCDVYSFGVVLLELLSGRRAVDRSLPLKKQNLFEWAIPNLTNKRRIVRVLDARLEGQYSPRQALQVAKLAQLCLSESPWVRPSMDELVTALEQIHDSEDTVKRAHKKRRTWQF